MVNRRKLTSSAFVVLLFIEACAPTPNVGDAVTEQSTDVDDYNVHIFGRRTGVEPCSLAQVARHTC
jgi:hypothetical protein